MTRKKWIPAIVLVILTIGFLVFYLINISRNNSTQWQNSLTVPANWELVSKNEGGDDIIDTPQQTATQIYTVPGDAVSALREFESSLARANYFYRTADVTGCESFNPTPYCYVSGENDSVSVRASKSVEDPNTIVVVITKK